LLEPVAALAPRLTDPQQVLETVFGYREFRPGQRHIIDTVLAGRDCIGVMPTGAGKSLTFQIPARILPGAVLVISPSRVSLVVVDEAHSINHRGHDFRPTYLHINGRIRPDLPYPTLHNPGPGGPVACSLG
jgi:superfamily II DNA helicase RecQ